MGTSHETLTQKAHMPQHMAPRGLLLSQWAQDSSRRVLLGLTDISKIQGIGGRKLAVSVLPAMFTVCMSDHCDRCQS